MKKSEFRKLIREEIRKVLTESATLDTTLADLFPEEGMSMSSIRNMSNFKDDSVMQINLPSPSADPVTSVLLKVKASDDIKMNSQLQQYLKDIVKYFGANILNQPIKVTGVGSSYGISILDPKYIKTEKERRDRIYASMQKDPGLAH